MDQELKAKWVKALRSGDFYQCPSKLSDGAGHCCLGVLLCVGAEGEWDGESFEFADQELGYAEGDLCSFRDVAGLTPEQEGRLVTMNDQEGATFPEIADYIEKNL